MYSIDNFYQTISQKPLPINTAELAKRTIIENLPKIKKQDLINISAFVNTGLKEFCIYGQRANNITYFALKSEVKEKLKDIDLINWG